MFRSRPFFVRRNCFTLFRRKTNRTGLPKKIQMIASFNRFEIEMDEDTASECSHQGSCDADVKALAPKIFRPESCTVDALKAELKEYGAWDDEQLSDDADNWERIVWIAAGNINEELVLESLEQP